MKKTRRYVSVVLVFAIMIMMNTRVFAYEPVALFDANHHTEVAEVAAAGEEDNVVSPNGTCLDCSWFGTMVCYQDEIIVDEGYHTTFGGLIQTDCYAFYFACWGAEMCLTCRAVLDDSYGYHYCKEVHFECSLGDYDVCPMPYGLIDLGFAEGLSA